VYLVIIGGFSANVMWEEEVGVGRIEMWDKLLAIGPDSLN